MTNKVVDARPSQRRTSCSADILQALDNVGFRWFHLKTAFISGSGFLADAYDLFVISLLSNLIGRIYFPDITYFPLDYCSSVDSLKLNPTCGSNWGKLKAWLDTNQPGWGLPDALCHAPSALPSKLDSSIKGVALVGTLFGQICFGYFGDKFGRRPMFGLTLVIMMLSAICSAMSFSNSPNAVIGTLCCFRFLLGFGIGGDYPLSATIMSEYASKRNRGMFLAAVFANQGLGYLVAGVVTIASATIWLGHESDRDFLWRFILALGALPPATTLYSRLLMPETARYTMMVRGDACAAARDMEGVLHTEFTNFDPALRIKSLTGGQFLRRRGPP